LINISLKRYKLHSGNLKTFPQGKGQGLSKRGPLSAWKSGSFEVLEALEGTPFPELPRYSNPFLS